MLFRIRYVDEEECYTMSFVGSLYNRSREVWKGVYDCILNMCPKFLVLDFSDVLCFPDWFIGFLQDFHALADAILLPPDYLPWYRRLERRRLLPPAFEFLEEAFHEIHMTVFMRGIR